MESVRMEDRYHEGYIRGLKDAWDHVELSISISQTQIEDIKDKITEILQKNSELTTSTYNEIYIFKQITRNIDTINEYIEKIETIEQIIYELSLLQDEFEHMIKELREYEYTPSLKEIAVEMMEKARNKEKCDG